jgi:hypothetical protein
MTESEKLAIVGEVELVLSLQGVQYERAAATEAALRLMGEEAYSTAPARKGEYVEWLDRLATAVLEVMGVKAGDSHGGVRVQSEGWDPATAGDVIRFPIGS